MMEYHDAWDDPNVKDALKQRDAAHICLICCEQCHNYGYYNEGNHFSCHWCDWSISGEDLASLIDDGEVVSLEDYTDMKVDMDDGMVP